MANRGQDQGASRFWTTQCARRYLRLLLLLLDFDCVAVAWPIAPVSQKLETGD